MYVFYAWHATELRIHTLTNGHVHKMLVCTRVNMLAYARGTYKHKDCGLSTVTHLEHI